MKGLEGRVEFQGTEIRERLAEIRQRADDLTPLMAQIGEALVESARERIEVSNKSPDGNSWPKSFRVTVGQGGKTLLNSGRLRDSIVSRPAGDQVEIGTNMIYAAVHQFGAAKGQFGARMGRTQPTEKRPRSQDFFVHLPWGDIPARPYLGISATDEALIVQDLIPAHFRVATDA